MLARDYALLNIYFEGTINGTYDPSKSKDYPTSIEYGPSWFESYAVFNNTKYIHGLNLAKATNGSGFLRNMLTGVTISCRYFQENDRLLYWELGNEPDLYRTSAQGVVRDGSYDENKYAAEWRNMTEEVRNEVRITCKDLAEDGKFKLVAPSFAGTRNSLDPWKAWQSGVRESKRVGEFSSHQYVSSRGS